MEKYTASNGVTVEVAPLGEMFVTKTDTVHVPKLERVQALREFFRHERDTMLGRWRDPDSTYLVVYPTDEPDTVAVFDEQAGWAWQVTRESKAYATSTLHDVVIAGHRYFAAHPVSMPWHDAKPGEVWAIGTIGYGDVNAIVSPRNYRNEAAENGPYFVFGNGEELGNVSYQVDSSSVLSGRLICPEVSGD